MGMGSGTSNINAHLYASFNNCLLD
jgi:hypothetical protein